MVTVYEDLVKGSTARLTLKEFDIVRAFLVTGITGSAAGQTIAATQATDSVTGFRIPVLNQPHPTLSTALCHGVSAKESLGDGAFYVYATYKQKIRPVPYIVDVGGSLTVSEVHYALQGTPLAWAPATVTYTPQVPSDPTSGGGQLVAGTPIKQVARLKFQRLVAKLEIKIYETTEPLAASTAYAGSVNTDVWRNGQPRTWMMLPIHGSTKDQQVWDNAYSFVYNPLTWDEYAFYRDQTGKCPADALSDLVLDGSKTSGNGWARFMMQPQIDFTATFPQLLGGG